MCRVSRLTRSQCLNLTNPEIYIWLQTSQRAQQCIRLASWRWRWWRCLRVSGDALMVWNCMTLGEVSRRGAGSPHCGTGGGSQGRRRRGSWAAGAPALTCEHCISCIVPRRQPLERQLSTAGSESDMRIDPPPPCAGATAQSLELYAQCGGKGGNCGSFACVDAPFPGKACPSGAFCHRQSEWYHQCVQGERCKMERWSISA